MFDIAAALIVLAIAAAIALPIVIYSLIRRNKRSKLLREFNLLAEKEKLIITIQEQWKDRYVIGIDHNSKKLLYVQKNDEKPEESFIDLSSFRDCRIESYNKTISNLSGKANPSDRIEMVFIPRIAGSPAKKLEFYDSTEFMPTPDDIALAEKWLRLIKENLV